MPQKEENQKPSWVKNESYPQENQPVSQGSTFKTLPSFGKLLKETWAMYKRKIWQLITIFLLAGVVTILFAYLFSLALTYLPPIVALALGFVSPFIGMILISWAMLAALILISDDKKNIGTALKETFPKLASYFWVIALTNLVTAGAMIPLIVPGIILGIALSFTMYVFAKEDRKGLNALLRSSDLTKNFRLAILGKMLLLALTLFVILIPVSIAVNLISQHSQGITQNIVSFLSMIFLTPFAFIYAYIIYQKLVDIKQTITFTPSKKGKNLYTFLAIWGIFAMIAMPIMSNYYIQRNIQRNLPGGWDVEFQLNEEDLEKMQEFQESEDLQKLQEMIEDMPVPQNPNQS
jgi:MFS family permease